MWLRSETRFVACRRIDFFFLRMSSFLKLRLINCTVSVSVNVEIRVFLNLRFDSLRIDSLIKLINEILINLVFEMQWCYWLLSFRRLCLLWTVWEFSMSSNINDVLIEIVVSDFRHLKLLNETRANHKIWNCFNLLWVF